MEVYSQPLDRVIFGQSITLRRNTQRASYFKYATKTKSFLADITADVLRMRLKQAADASSMKLKTFLECHQVNIILALKDNHSRLLLVYPPKGISLDLLTWNTGLLCLVLRACNCLTVREQDDVIYLAAVYRRYFNRKHQHAGTGATSKKGYQAKQEWIGTCSAVQRMVEVVDDAGLMKGVRNFICKVEIEEKTLRGKQDKEFRPETLLLEMNLNNAVSKNREENLTDEAKQIAKRQISGLNRRQRQRPRSAGARLSLNCKYGEHLDSDIKNQISSVSRHTTACKHDLPASSGKRVPCVDKSSERKGTGTEHIHQEDELPAYKRDTRGKDIKYSSKKKDKVRTRPLSANERTTSATTPFADNRPKSAITLKTKSVESNIENSVLVHNSKREKYRYLRPLSARDKRPIISILKEKCPLNPHVLKKNAENGNDALTKNTNVSKKKSTRDNQINSKLSFRSSTVRRRPMSSRSTTNSRKKFNSEQNIKDTVIRVPTAEPGSLEADDTDNISDGKHINRNKVKCKRNVAADEEIDKKQEIDKKTEESNATEKRKLFDDNMKKIANEVLVHQRVHEAAKNTLLRDKEFVDEFFSFLNENHVTKKFLRVQSTKANHSWKLPNGKHVDFSFFLAFIFRPIENKDISMVSYVVEKILLRMRCGHSVQKKPGEVESNIVKGENVEMNAKHVRLGESSFSSEHENRRKIYREVSNSLNKCQLFKGERHRNSSRHRSLSRERGVTTGKPKRRSRSASKSRKQTENGTDMPVLYRSTSITDNQCWKCLQKGLALTACVNWSNRILCDLLISEGIPYMEEHLSAAVKANDLITLVKIVDFLRYNGIWKPSHREAKNALFLAKKHRMQKAAEFLTEEGVRDDRSVNQSACTPCFIA